MLGHVLRAVRSSGVDRCAVVVGPDMPDVHGFVDVAWPGAEIFEQTERLGTAHAVIAARDAYLKSEDDVIVLFGDTPLVTPQAIDALRKPLRDGAAVSVYGFRPDNPGAYGRLLMNGDQLEAIREAKDASPEELAVGFCNGGLMGFDGSKTDAILSAIGNENAKGEYYLTDAAAIANSRGDIVSAIDGSVEDVSGVNTLVELADLELLYQNRKRREFMLSGVQMQAPQTAWFSHDTVIEPGVIIEPNVVFGPGVTVRAGTRVKAFSHLEDATVAENADIGPYARLRPGADIGEKAKVGNFVEVKKAVVAAGAKINHLSYVGDAEIGAGANIGAGTITCNYDGVNKHLTRIGADAFVGSNSALVAPVSIGEGAYVASGSVITANVEPDALAFGRARQTNKPDRAPKPSKK